MFGIIVVMNKPSLQQLTSALHESWPVEIGNAVVGDWTPENPARGQCIPSSLVVQDYFGGDIVRYAVTAEGINETHYFNVLKDGTIIDTTGSQYKVPVSMIVKPIDLAKNSFQSVRERCLADDDTRMRYELLQSRVESILKQLT